MREAVTVFVLKIATLCQLNFFTEASKHTIH